MTDDVFTETNSNTEEGTSSTDNNSLFEIGDRKYDVAAAKTKIENADSHITKLEQENAELRDQLKTAKTIDDVLDVMNKPSEDTQETSALSRDDLSNVIKEELEARTQADIKASNRQTSSERLRERFGEEAKTKIEEVGQSLNIGPQTMKDIAEKSPDAFMKLFGEEPSVATPSPSTGSINTESLKQNNSGPKQGTYAWYQKMLKENPKLEKSMDFNKQMMEDAKRLGQEEFFR